MAKKHYELDTRVLTIFFFVAMPFVAFGSFLAVSMARSALEGAQGSIFEQRATETRFLIERYVGDQIVQMRLVTQDPLVRAALQAARKPRTADEMKRLEAAWAGSDDPKLLAPVLASPVAARLREMAQVRPAVKLLQVVDASGALVATSSRAGRLQAAESPWFKALTTDGVEAPYVGDIERRPAGTGTPLLEVAFPVYDAQAQFLGAVRGLLDAQDLYSVIAPVRVGRTGRALLLRASDGMVLASDESDKVLSKTYPGFAQVQAALESRQGFWSIAESRQAVAGGEVATPARLVGVSPVEQVPNVKWLVVVEQDLTEATAPVQQVTRYLWVHFIGAFGSVILLALYLSFKLETPVIEDELHLHEEHVPASMRSGASPE